MKIVIMEGCTAFNTSVDGVSLVDFSKKELEDFLDKLLAKIREDVVDHAIQIDSVIQLMQYDSYKSDEEPCEQCGDYVTKTTWEI